MGENTAINATIKQASVDELIEELEARGGMAIYIPEETSDDSIDVELPQREYDRVKKIRFIALLVSYLLLAVTIVYFNLDPARYRIIMFLLFINYAIMLNIQGYIWDKCSKLFGRDTY